VACLRRQQDSEIAMENGNVTRVLARVNDLDGNGLRDPDIIRGTGELLRSVEGVVIVVHTAVIT